MAELNFFSAGSPFLSHPLLTAERTAHEIDFVMAALAVSPPDRLLDIGCGFGRHSIELARRGYQVTAIDPALAMIDTSREHAAAAGVSVDFRLQPGEDFASDTVFDGAICLFTSLGQISDSGENSGLVRRVSTALRPGGRFIVEVPQRGTAVSQLKSGDIFSGPEQTTTITRRYDPAKHTVTEDFHLEKGPAISSFRLQYRLYDRTELLALLEEAGFVVRGAFGDYDYTPLGDQHATMILIGEKT